MADSSPAGPRPASGRHSIGFSFLTTVAAPVAALALLWAGTALATVTSQAARHALGLPDDHAIGELALFIGGVIVVAASMLLIGLFARRLSRDVSDLAATAGHYADVVLPGLVARLRAGSDGAGAAPGPGPAVRTGSAELASAVAAIARLEQAAAAAANGEASLRDGLRLVFVSLARRNQSLLQRQLRLIDALEHKASDPAALADLFALDHLTTRMRRHAESLAILSGAAPGRSWTEPVPVIDIIRAATAEVEDYQRVAVLATAEDAVAAPAVADLIHLLAELIENATMFSPSGTRVEVRAERVANGFAVEIEDRGLGIEPSQLSELNRQLAAPPDFDLANADRLGLFVGAKLAVRHGIRVSLRPSPYGGTTAIVLMPGAIVSPPAQVHALSPGGSRPGGTGRFPTLDLRSAGALGVLRNAPAAIAVPAPGPGGAGPGGAGPGASRAAVAGPATAPVADAAQPGGPDVHPAPAARLSAASPLDLAASPGPDGGPDGGPAPALPGGRRPLPQRTRQASLSPHLLGAAAADDGPAPAPARSRSPEQARDLAKSLQTGWRRGREEPAGEPPAVPPRDAAASWPATPPASPWPATPPSPAAQPGPGTPDNPDQPAPPARPGLAQANQGGQD